MADLGFWMQDHPYLATVGAVLAYAFVDAMVHAYARWATR